jgi:hypothetical protein
MLEHLKLKQNDGNMDGSLMLTALLLRSFAVGTEITGIASRSIESAIRRRIV